MHLAVPFSTFKRKMKKTSLLLLSVLLMFSCGKQEKKAPADSAYSMDSDSILAHVDEFSDTVTIRYARGLRVEYHTDGIHIYISNPDPSVRNKREEHIVVHQPASRFICTTALQLGNFEVLGLEDKIVGINSLRNLFSPRIKEQMENGQTVKIGKEGVFDLETVIAARPEYIFVSASKHGGFESLKECGIPLISHHGYKETHPLGQAEWIKLIGLLTGETRRANAIFSDIEEKYLALKEKVQHYVVNHRRPTVISGRQMRDGWYVAGGRSYLAQLFEDAGADYIMSDNEDSGGTTLDFEAVYARGLHADFWQTDGSHAEAFTMETLAKEDPRYATMDAFKNHRIIFCNFAQTPYRELAGVEPHILLADFVKAFHPELLPEHEGRFYTILVE